MGFYKVTNSVSRDFGELSEWSIEVVLKTIDRVERSGGSNPSLSAINSQRRRVLRSEDSLRRLAVRVQVGIVHKFATVHLVQFL